MAQEKKKLEHTVYCAIRAKRGRGVYPDLWTAAFRAPACIRKLLLGEDRANVSGKSRTKHGRVIGIVKYKMIEEKRLTREEMAAFTGNVD